MILHFNHEFFSSVVTLCLGVQYYYCTGRVIKGAFGVFFFSLWGWEWGSEETKAIVGLVPVGTEPP